MRKTSHATRCCSSSHASNDVLHVAARAGQEETCKVLLHYAQLDEVDYHQLNISLSPTDAALEKGHMRLGRLLGYGLSKELLPLAPQAWYEKLVCDGVLQAEEDEEVKGQGEGNAADKKNEEGAHSSAVAKDERAEGDKGGSHTAGTLQVGR